jgi:hypothetical protein
VKSRATIVENVIGRFVKAEFETPVKVISGEAVNKNRLSKTMELQFLSMLLVSKSRTEFISAESGTLPKVLNSARAFRYVLNPSKERKKISPFAEVKDSCPVDPIEANAIRWNPAVFFH